MVRTRFALILYFRMVVHKAAFHTISKAFLKSVMKWYRVCQCWKNFSHRILKLKICSVALLPALNQACPSVRLPPSGVVLAPSLIDPSDWDSWMWVCLISSKQVIDLSTAYNIYNQTQGAKLIGLDPYLQ